MRPFHDDCGEFESGCVLGLLRISLQGGNRLRFAQAGEFAQRCMSRGAIIAAVSSCEGKREFFCKPSTEATFPQSRAEGDITVQDGWRLSHSTGHVGYNATRGITYIKVSPISSGSRGGIHGWDSLVVHSFLFSVLPSPSCRIIGRGELVQLGCQWLELDQSLSAFE
jgi:hypothetical protein